MADDEELSEQAFAEIARRAGLNIPEDELATMREGYIGLQRLLRRLPQSPEPLDEPSCIFLPSGTRPAK